MDILHDLTELFQEPWNLRGNVYSLMGERYLPAQMQIRDNKGAFTIFL
jgi:hypothetical protein